MTTGAWKRLDTGKERKRRGLEKVEEGLEVLTANPIELQRPDAGDRRWWSSLRTTEVAHTRVGNGAATWAQARTALQDGVARTMRSRATRKCCKATVARRARGRREATHGLKPVRGKEGEQGRATLRNQLALARERGENHRPRTRVPPR